MRRCRRIGVGYVGGGQVQAAAEVELDLAVDPLIWTFPRGDLG
jgi:hypothetical protein